jgi:hypothetical protein
MVMTPDDMFPPPGGRERNKSKVTLKTALRGAVVAFLLLFLMVIFIILFIKAVAWSWYYIPGPAPVAEVKVE